MIIFLNIHAVAVLVSIWIRRRLPPRVAHLGKNENTPVIRIFLNIHAVAVLVAIWIGRVWDSMPVQRWSGPVSMHETDCSANPDRASPPRTLMHHYESTR